MKFADAIDAYVRDMWVDGAFRSERSERSYRSVLCRHLEDVGNRDPAYIGVEDVKRTLGRWRNTNTKRTAGPLMSFYRWTVQAGIRRDNPVERTKRLKKQPTDIYRLTRAEAVALLLAAEKHQGEASDLSRGLRRSSKLGASWAAWIGLPAGRLYPRARQLREGEESALASCNRRVTARGGGDPCERGPEEYVLPAQRSPRSRAEPSAGGQATPAIVVASAAITGYASGAPRGNPHACESPFDAACIR